MKNLLIFVVILFLLALNTSAQDEILINGNFQGNTLFFEPEYNILGIDIGTSWRLGYYNKSYTIGLAVTFDYTLYDNMDEAENVHGSWLHTRVLLDQAYKISSGFETKWAFGFIWLNNNIKYGESEMQVNDFYGGSFDLILRFTFPGQFFICEILNRIDLLYSLNEDFHLTHMSPHYYGGLRFYIDFGIKWFQIYLEAKGQYWNYSNSEYDISTGIASGGLGFCLNLPPFKIENTAGKKENSLNGVNGSNPESNPIEDIEPEQEKLDPEVEKLRTITKGDKVQFHNILFVKFKDELLPVSFPILDQIIKVLKERQEIKFIISAYAEYQENPVVEFKLYTSRAKKIKEYLIKGGIEGNRLKVSSIGQIVTENNRKQGLTVIFKIAKEEE